MYVAYVLHRKYREEYIIKFYIGYHWRSGSNWRSNESQGKYVASVDLIQSTIYNISQSTVSIRSGCNVCVHVKTKKETVFICGNLKFVDQGVSHRRLRYPC